MGKYSLIAADGCEFNIARNPRGPSTFHPTSGRSKKDFNSLHTISLYDLLSKRYLDVVIQPGRLKNEFAALCQLIDRYIYGGCPIFVADRGFASYNVFAHALEKDCFFAIRAKDINIRRLLAADSLPGRMDRWADVILTRSNAKRKGLHPELGPLYLCICIEFEIPCRMTLYNFCTIITMEVPIKKKGGNGNIRSICPWR